MKAIDEINKKFGRDMIRLAVANKGKWQMKARYTTRIKQILKRLISK